MTGTIETVLIRPNRMFGSYVANVVIEEIGRDDMEITRHPVENSIFQQGAFITDHAFKLPAELSIRMGWTDSSIGTLLSGGITQGLATLSADGISADNSVVMYQNLLNLQQSGFTFTIVTTKRTYKNMLIESLTAPTTIATENSLMVTARCREIIIVQTQTVSTTSADVQANPMSNAPTLPSGVQQCLPGTNLNQSDASGIISSSTGSTNISYAPGGASQ